MPTPTGKVGLDTELAAVAAPLFTALTTLYIVLCNLLQVNQVVATNREQQLNTLNVDGNLQSCFRARILLSPNWMRIHVSAKTKCYRNVRGFNDSKCIGAPLKCDSSD